MPARRLGSCRMSLRARPGRCRRQRPARRSCTRSRRWSSRRDSLSTSLGPAPTAHTHRCRTKAGWWCSPAGSRRRSRTESHRRRRPGSARRTRQSPPYTAACRPRRCATPRRTAPPRTPPAHRRALCRSRRRCCTHTRPSRRCRMACSHHTSAPPRPRSLTRHRTFPARCTTGRRRTSGWCPCGRSPGCTSQPPCTRRRRRSRCRSGSPRTRPPSAGSAHHNAPPRHRPGRKCTRPPTAPSQTLPSTQTQSQAPPTRCPPRPRSPP
mmetsp:Transcript_46602/g.93281  ORF Transcript_46602/g.93281 Transcript_46602/m.93281 type:complete len:266 (-) Transcript_46602:1496-2293(-)